MPKKCSFHFLAMTAFSTENWYEYARKRDISYNEDIVRWL